MAMCQCCRKAVNLPDACARQNAAIIPTALQEQAK